MPIQKAIAVYMRVSHNSQSLENQEPDIKRWLEQNNTEGLPVIWYKEKTSATRGKQPKWEEMEEAVKRNQIERILVWRLDRLGRKVSRLAPFVELLLRKDVTLVSIREGLDQKTPMGRAMLMIILVLAQMESEVISERTKAGLERVKAERGGQIYKHPERRKMPRGLSKKHVEKRKQVRKLIEGGMALLKVARLTHTDPNSIYSWIEKEGWDYKWKNPEKRKCNRKGPAPVGNVNGNPPAKIDTSVAKQLTDLFKKDPEVEKIKDAYNDGS